MKIRRHVLRMVEERGKGSLSSQRPPDPHTSPRLHYLLLGACQAREKPAEVTVVWVFFSNQTHLIHLLHEPKETHKFNKNGVHATQTQPQDEASEPASHQTRQTSPIKILEAPLSPTARQHLLSYQNPSYFWGPAPLPFSIQCVWMTHTAPPQPLPGMSKSLPRPLRVLTTPSVPRIS